ncbi:lactonase family protein [Tautonia sp. JC769]|uniref:lactonase family protein n=1 Tax=Tautonia sp. JC769 TaxID=3232135 RepID=UPI0034595C70
MSSFAGGADGVIRGFSLDPATGELEQLYQSDPIPHPFFFNVTPDHGFLYTIHAESFGGPQDEQIAAYRFEKDAGTLRLLNRQTTRGSASCFVEIDAEAGAVLVANYATGSVVSYQIKDDGSLSPPVSFVQHAGSSVNEARQSGPHAHCFVIGPNNRFAYAADLGLDQILCYALDASTGTVTPNVQPFVRTPPGSGPRHLTFHPGGRTMYVINELLNSVTRFDFEEDSGILIERETISTLPDDFAGESYCADVKITPDGKFLYGTNRGHDSIAMYRIAEKGALRLIGFEPSLGEGPQNLAITADGRLLLCANMPGNRVTVFRIDPQSGDLTPLGTPLEVTSPSCLRILEEPPSP